MSAVPEKTCLMGIDIGAGSLKTMIIDSSGRVRGSAAVDIVTHSPHPLWSEQDPEDWWKAVCTTVPMALKEAGLTAGQIAAISFSAGAHTPVLEDGQGRLVRPAILWNDQRSGAESRELQEKYGDRILAIGLNRPAPTWTLPQFLWLARHEPDAVRRTARVYVAKDWLRSRLTGTWETDRTEAVGTLLFDAANDRWSPELCDMAHWDIATLPPLVTPTTIVGQVTAAAARAAGLAEGTPVVCGTSDTSIETFGAGSVRPGDGTVKLATAGTISVVSREPRVHPTLINYPLAVPGLWYTITGTNSCASAHRWFRDRFMMGAGTSGSAAFAEIDRLAATVRPGAEGLLFHPYLQGERAPYWDPMLRADFVGMTFRHDKAHFSRAIYEGIAFSLRDVLDQFRAQEMDIRTARIIGGGSKSATWRQIVADVLNVEILLPETTDASFGAALLAGVGIGVFSDELSAAAACAKVIDRSTPDPDNVAFYDRLFGVYKEAQAGLANVNHALSRITG
ncbi:xylulokinase [Noviherbaspirillum sp. Root189]|uniref:xylulokinase n=1 Tax=Noviherbaspirillum sp. Root189 TaxID=1736487 RepID=UPI00070A3FDE|nr:xylulokinase [Noviherbaspirillum sp. Root189]KRB70578.1 carbohydrate kinase [Noviherbaspirillum sp. Root189]